MLSIQEQYEHPLWESLSTKIKCRDGYTCQICKKDFRGFPRRLEVHHIFRVKGLHLWDYDDDSLITLCINCHQKADEPAMKKLAGLLVIKALKGKIDLTYLLNYIENGKEIH